MGKIVTNKINLSGETTPPVGSFIVAYDLDGVLKQMDSSGLIRPIADSGNTGTVSAVLAGFNMNTGGTASFPVIGTNADVNFVSLSGGTVSGGTYFSGSTPLISVIISQITAVTSNNLTILEFQTSGVTPAVYNFTFNDGDILNYKITGTNGGAGVHIFDRGFSPLSNGATTIFDNSTGTSGEGQTINLNVVGNILTVTMTGVAAETWNWMFEYRFSQF